MIKQKEMFQYEMELNAWHYLYVELNYVFDSDNAVRKLDEDFMKHVENILEE